MKVCLLFRNIWTLYVMNIIFLHVKKKPFNAIEKAFLGSGKRVKGKKESSLYFMELSLCSAC